MSGPPRNTIPRLADLDVVIPLSRILLRPLRESDVEDMWPVVSDPKFPRHMSWAAHTDRSETHAFIQQQHEAFANGTSVTWAIEHDGRASGCIGLDGIRWELRAWRIDRAELGYWIAPHLAGQGLMTEAAHAVMGFGFETLGLHKITVGCIAENDASRRVIEKCGFRYLARHEDDVWRDDRWWAHLRYELTGFEWSDTTSTRRFMRGQTQ